MTQSKSSRSKTHHGKRLVTNLAPARNDRHQELSVRNERRYVCRNLNTLYLINFEFERTNLIVLHILRNCNFKQQQQQQQRQSFRKWYSCLISPRETHKRHQSVSHCCPLVYVESVTIRDGQQPLETVDDPTPPCQRTWADLLHTWLSIGLAYLI